MSKINNGGYAFPVPIAATTNSNGDPILYDSLDHCLGGMTLRDYFAAKAIDSNMREAVAWYEGGNDCDVYARAARGAYRMADAMLAARQIGGDE